MIPRVYITKVHFAILGTFQPEFSILVSGTGFWRGRGWSGGLKFAKDSVYPAKRGYSPTQLQT